MGCIGSREKKNYERIFLEIDNELKFHELYLDDIKTAFFSIKNKKITLDEMTWCLSKTTLQQDDHNNHQKLQNFLEIFKINSDFDVIFYDFFRVLLVMVLYCKDKIEEKYEVIFDLFDVDKDGKLFKNDVQQLFFYILETIFQFSREMLIANKTIVKDSEIDHSLGKTYEEITNKTHESFISYMMKGNEVITRRKFVKHIAKFSLNEKLLDFSSPKTIRKSIFQNFLKEYPKIHELPK